MARWVKRRQQRSRQRGVALVMVLSALAILAVMLTEFQQETSAELGSAMSERDAVQAEYSARSAIALTRLVIAAEPTIRSAIGFLLTAMKMGNVQIPVWAHTDLLLGVFNDEASAKDFGKMLGSSLEQTKGLGLPGGRFEVKIVDEDSKLNFNYAARGTVPASMVVTNQFLSLVQGQQYDPLFEGRDVDGNFKDRRIICSAIVDWVDPNNDADPCTPEVQTATQTSSEDSFYEGLKHPYHRKNAAFDSLEEMHLVRGIDDEFWNTFIDPDTDDPSKRIVTVWGSDKVNVNTANGFALVTLICEFAKNSPACTDSVMRSKIVSAIEMARGMVPGMPLFRSPKGFIRALKPDPSGTSSSPVGMLLEAIGVPPIEITNEALLKERIKLKSDIFSIYAKGIVKSGKRETVTRIHSVVDFRGAPPPGEGRVGSDVAMAAGADLSVGASAPAASASASATAQGLPPGYDPDQFTPESVLAALQASAGGHIIYYRIN